MTTKKETAVTTDPQEKNIADTVLGRLTQMQQAGGVVMPKDYVPANALKLAWLIIQEVKDRNKRPALEVCTAGSVAQALLKMCIEGLDASKKHGSFIVYGNQLTWQREYAGNIALAKRVGMRDVNAQIIYKGDVFEYEVDAATGIKRIVKHIPEFENQSNDNITGAYAVTQMIDGVNKLEIMTIAQIEQAWKQGQMNGEGPVHKNFRDQMALKTVINRATKLIIRSSNDAHLESEIVEPQVIDHVHTEIETTANQKELTMPVPAYEDAPEVVNEETGEVKKDGALF